MKYITNSTMAIEVWHLVRIMKAHTETLYLKQHIEAKKRG